MMIHDVILTLADGATLKIVATLIFFAIFVAIVLWLVLSRSKRFKRMARMPLEDDEIIEPRQKDADGNPEDG
jgi:hypothetical protein